MRTRALHILEAVLVDAYLWVAFAAAGLTLYAGHALGLPLLAGPPLVAFASTGLIYAVDEWFDARDRGGQDRVATRKAWRVAVPIAAFVLVSQLAVAPPRVLVVVVAGGLPCLLYSMPVRGARLRDLPGVKPLFVTAALTVAAVAVPLAWASAPPPAVGRILGLGVVLFAVVLCNVCFFDLRDLAADAARGVRTVPVRFGVRGTRILCLTTCGLVGLALSVRQLTGAVVDPALVAATCATAVYAAWLPATSNRLGYALTVDGVPVLLGVAAVVGTG